MRRLLRTGLWFLALYLGVAALALMGAQHAGARHREALQAMEKAAEVKGMALQTLLDAQTIHRISLSILVDPDRLDLAPEKTAAFDRMLANYQALKALQPSIPLRQLVGELEKLHVEELTPSDTRVLELVYEDVQAARKAYQDHHEPLLGRYEVLTRKAVARAETEAAQAESALRGQADWLVAADAGTAVGLGLLGALTLGVFLGLVRRQARQLDSAITVLHRVAEGHLDERMEGNAADAEELQRIYTAFNDMLTRLQERDALLQQEKSKAEQATTDLRHIVGEMHRLGLQLDTSTEAIAGQVKAQESAASEHASSSAQVLASSKEISAISRELVYTVNDVVQLSQRTATLAESSQQGQGLLRTVLAGLSTGSVEIVEKLGNLREQAQGINKVTATLIKIADKTNILSLNAAIEAEQAGQYGAGFGVVAQEILRLANNTAHSIMDIEATIQDMQTAVDSSSTLIGAFAEHVRQGTGSLRGIGDQLAEIGTQVQALAPRFEEVRRGMEQQHQGAEQITLGVHMMTELARKNAASLRETNGALGHAQTIARELRTVMAQVTVAE
jgi:methyl-accepting chemotaxis protein WspA